VSSDGTHVWVTNEGGDTVSEIDASTGTVVNTIRVGSGPIGVSSDGSDVWVGNENGDTVTDIRINVQGFAQQGAMLVGTGAVGDARQGYSVALSSDGSTALVGGPYDHRQKGAVWVFTRSRGRWTQQGPKLVGTGAAGKAQQGYSVALSSDGNTALVGAPHDHGGVGAVWVFTRSRGRWTQQGAKLVGTGADPLFGQPEGGAGQGLSVALSSDGNTALVGGEGQNHGNSDAAWVFTRSRGRWTQQGPKLLADSGEHGGSVFLGVALSSDGSTALVDGPYHNVEAAWVFTRSRGRWTQHGPKLVGTGAAKQYGNQHGGDNVALSSNGNTALVGSQSAVWVFTRSRGRWTQQGPKLDAEWGSVALSSDGNTAISNGGVFTRSGNTWSQQGSTLFGTSENINDEPSDVALSSDGNTALVGGLDNRNKGAVWVFVR
jgi:YVTN family beta-propeller protein